MQLLQAKPQPIYLFFGCNSGLPEVELFLDLVELAELGMDLLGSLSEDLELDLSLLVLLGQPLELVLLLLELGGPHLRSLRLLGVHRLLVQSDEVFFFVDELEEGLLGVVDFEAGEEDEFFGGAVVGDQSALHHDDVAVDELILSPQISL